MTDALRELLARFVVQVDPDGALKKGEAQVDALAQSLRKLDGAFGKLNVGAFARLGAGASGGFRNPLAGIGAAVDASSLGIQRGVGGFIKGIATLQNGLAALAGGFIGSQVKALIDDIGGIGESAAKLGVGNADFQRLSVLAEQNAVSVQALGASFQILSRNVVQPSEQAKAAIAELGVEVRNSDGTFRDRQELFFEVAGALADVEDSTKRAALGQALLGEGARQLAPLIAGGRDALEAQRAELMKLPIVAESAIAAADHFGDRWVVTLQRLKVVAAGVLEKAVLPILELTLDVIDALAGAFTKLTKVFSPFTIGLAATVVALSPFVAQLRLLIALGGGVGPMLKNMARSFGGLVKAVAPAIAAFILLEDLFTFFAGGDSLIGRGLEKAFGPEFTKNMNELRDAAQDLWGWITGDNVNLTGKTKALLDEIALGLKLLVNDTLALIPFSGRVAGLKGLEDYEAGKLDAPGTVKVPAAQGPAQSFVFDPASGGYRNVTVNINNPPPGEAQAIAGQVRNVLDRDRNGDLANVQ